MNQYYKFEITKVTDGEESEGLLGRVDNLDELVNDIDQIVERMQPAGYSQKKKDHSLMEVKKEIINQLYQKINSKDIGIDRLLEIYRTINGKEKD